jgi:hypothetical protein
MIKDNVPVEYQNQLEVWEDDQDVLEDNEEDEYGE